MGEIISLIEGKCGELIAYDSGSGYVLELEDCGGFQHIVISEKFYNAICEEFNK